MSKFVTIGYGDQAGYDRTDAAVRDAAHASDARLQGTGAVMGMAGEPVQVRNHDGSGVQVTSGAFASAALPIAGFAVIDAPTIEEAVELAAQNPCAVAHGVVEVWPLVQP